MESELTDWFDQGEIDEEGVEYLYETLWPQLKYDPIDWKNAYPNVMDNLVGTDLPPFVLVAVGLAGPGGNYHVGADNCGDGPWALAPWKEKLAAKKSA